MKHLNKKLAVEDSGEQVEGGEDGVNDLWSEPCFKQLFGWSTNSARSSNSATELLPTLSKTPAMHIDIPNRCDTLQSDGGSKEVDVGGNDAKCATMYDRVKHGRMRHMLAGPGDGDVDENVVEESGYASRDALIYDRVNQRWMRQGLTGPSGGSCSNLDCYHDEDDGGSNNMQLEVITVKNNIVSVTGGDCCNLSKQMPTNGILANQNALSRVVSAHRKHSDTSSNQKSLNSDALANQTSSSTYASASQTSTNNFTNESDQTHRRYIFNGEESNWYTEGCFPRNHVLSWLPRCQRLAGRYGIEQRLMYQSPIVMVNCSPDRVTAQLPQDDDISVTRVKVDRTFEVKDISSVPRKEDNIRTNRSVDVSVKYKKHLRAGKKVDYMKTKVNYFGMCDKGTECNEDGDPNTSIGIVEEDIVQDRTCNQKGDNTAVKSSTSGVSTTGKQHIGLNEHFVAEDTDFVPKKRIYDNVNTERDYSGPETFRKRLRTREKIDYMGTKIGQFGMPRKSAEDTEQQSNRQVSTKKATAVLDCKEDSHLAKDKEQLNEACQTEVDDNHCDYYRQVSTKKATAVVEYREDSHLGKDKKQLNEACQIEVDDNHCDYYKVRQIPNNDTLEVESQRECRNDSLTIQEAGPEMFRLAARPPLLFESEKHLKLYDEKQDAVDEKTASENFRSSTVYEESVLVAKDYGNTDCMNETAEMLGTVTEGTGLHICDDELVCKNRNEAEEPVKKWLRVRKKIDYARTNIDNFGMPSKNTKFHQSHSSCTFLNDDENDAKCIQGNDYSVDMKKPQFEDDNLGTNTPVTLEFMQDKNNYVLDKNNNVMETKDDFVKQRSETVVFDKIAFSASKLVGGLAENLGDQEPSNIDNGTVESLNEDYDSERLFTKKHGVPLSELPFANHKKRERSDTYVSMDFQGSAKHHHEGRNDGRAGMSTDTDKEQLKTKDHLQVGSVVWGKFSKRWWPAVVIDGEMLGRSNKVGHTWVYWLSDRQVSQMKDVSVEPFYTSFAQRTVLKSLSKNMREGLQRAFEICAQRGEIEADECSGAMDWGLDGGYLQAIAEDGGIFSPNAGSPIPVSVLDDLHRLARMMSGVAPSRREAVLDDEADLAMQFDSDEDGPDKTDLNKGEQLPVGKGTICIACDEKFSTTFKHPLFDGRLCGKCREILKCRLYALDDDGYCLYCGVCGQGGEVFLCDDIQCARVYCADCMEDHASAEILEGARCSDRWLCFLCTDYSAETHGDLKPRPDWRQEVVKFFQAGQVSLCEDLHYLTVDCKRRIRVLSLFDGVATGKVALDELGMDVDVYYTSEVNEDAEIVTSYHHKVVPLGDAWNLTRKKLEEICPIDLVIGGPPCNDLSIVNPQRKGFSGSGILLIKFITILKDVEALCKEGSHVFWVLENSGAMLTEYKQIICKLLEMKPAVWDAKHFSGQRRARNFWGNIPGMYSTPDLCRNLEQDKTELDDAIVTSCNRKAQVSHSRTITTAANSLTIHNGRDDQLVLMNGQEDGIWTQELERLFGLPAHYTDVGPLTHQRRRRLLGKAWSVPVIKHILSPLKQFYRLKQ